MLQPSKKKPAKKNIFFKLAIYLSNPAVSTKTICCSVEFQQVAAELLFQFGLHALDLSFCSQLSDTPFEAGHSAGALCSLTQLGGCWMSLVGGVFPTTILLSTF